MAGEGATVAGVDRAAAAYDAVASDARNMGEPHRRIAAAGAQGAKARAPVRTGQLAGTIAGTATDTYAEQLVVGVRYWPTQEFGTRYVAGQRFMRDGIDAMRAVAPEAYAGRMAAIVKAHT